MWVVMTSRASMPATCWGRYRNVALVQLNQEYTSHDMRPCAIDVRVRGVLRVLHMGVFHVGKTEKGAYQRALIEADRRAVALNNAAPSAADDVIMSWGGSA